MKGVETGALPYPRSWLNQQLMHHLTGEYLVMPLMPCLRWLQRLPPVRLTTGAVSGVLLFLQWLPLMLPTRHWTGA